MKFIPRILTLTVTLALSASLNPARAQDKLSNEDKAKLAARYQQLAAPGDEHRRLEALAGSWNEEIKFWEAPGTPPMTLKGTCENRMILGGRFLRSETKGTGPFPFATLSLLGFDRRYNRYTYSSYDDQGTYYVTAAGPYDAAQNAVVMYGEDVDPVLGHTQKYNVITRIISPEKYVTAIIFKDDAHTQGRGDFKAVEITHTGASKAADANEMKSPGRPVVHFEIGCRDSAKTAEFYGKLFDWNIQVQGLAGTIQTGGTGGIDGHITALGHEPYNYVTVYVEVDDPQAYLAKAVALGGKIVVPPVKIPTGAFAWLRDPDGNLIGLFKPKQ